MDQEQSREASEILLEQLHRQVLKDAYQAFAVDFASDEAEQQMAEEWLNSPMLNAWLDQDQASSQS